MVEVVVNPNSGRGRGLLYARQVADALAAAGVPVRRTSIADFFGERPDLEPADLLVTVGGDGTVRAVVEALHQRPAPPTPVCVVPVGTANLLAKHLGCAWPAEDVGPAVAAAVVARRVREIDVVGANGKAFLLMASIGFDAAVVHDLAERRDGPITRLTYVPSLARAFWRFDRHDLTVTLDGTCIFGPGPAFVIVANVPEYGTGFPLAPGAVSTDGLLDVTVLPLESRIDAIHAAALTILGRLERGDAIFRRGRSVRVEGGAPMQLDGEAMGHTPATIELLPRRQPFVVTA